MHEAATFVAMPTRTAIGGMAGVPRTQMQKPKLHGAHGRRGTRACWMSLSPSNGTSSSSDGAKAEGELSASERYLGLMRELTAAETALSNPLGLKLSHEIVQLDENGDGPRDRYVYVEEQDCIGCTHCATTANQTFFMEPEYGRARVFSQTGDLESVVQVAIETCPVNCIYYVDWGDLVELEKDRVEQEIDSYARLVGNQPRRAGRRRGRRETVIDSGVIRCEDCPTRGCKECPLFGVGENPEYQRRIAMRKAKKTKREEEKKKKGRRLV